MTTSLATRETIDKFKVGVNGLLEKYGLTVCPRTGITFGADVTQEQVIDAAQRMMTVAEVNSAQKTLIDQYLGQIIVGFSAMADVSWAEAISTLNLVQDTGKGFKSLIKLPRIVTLLPEEAFSLGLTSGHLDAATSFAGPKDPEQAGQFNIRRMDILRKAADDPVERNKSWVLDEMRKLQREFEVSPSRKVPTNDIRKAFEVCSQALVEWDQDDYENFGIKRNELLDRWYGYRDELIERGLLPDDSTNPVVFTLPWNSKQNDTGPIIDAEAEVLPAEEDVEQEATSTVI